MKSKMNWSWLELNAWLKTANETQVTQLLADERERSPRRGQFIKRIHSRLNKLRADRERAELLK